MPQYFWLACGLWCGVVGAGYARFAVRKNIEAGEFSREEVWSFTRGYALWIFLPCLALWLLQQSVGSDASPEYWKWPDRQKLAALALQIFTWAALLYWVFLNGGANTLSKYLQATKRSQSSFSSPIAIKIAAVAVVLAGLGALWGSYG
jgi:hypothetical protein